MDKCKCKFFHVIGAGRLIARQRSLYTSTLQNRQFNIDGHHPFFNTPPTRKYQSRGRCEIENRKEKKKKKTIVKRKKVSSYSLSSTLYRRDRNETISPPTTLAPPTHSLQPSCHATTAPSPCPLPSPPPRSRHQKFPAPPLRV